MSAFAVEKNVGWGLLLFLTAALIVIGIRLVPMGHAVSAWASPDLLYLLFVYWLIRRPRSAPVLAVVFLALLADALMMRPMGLWAVCLLVGTEFVRAYVRAFREQPFLLEWLNISLLFAALLAAQNVLLLLTFSQPFALGTLFSHFLMTVAFYPIVYGVFGGIFRIHAPVAQDGASWKRRGT